MVEALGYKPQGRGFDSQWGHWDFVILPASLWTWGRLSLEQKSVPGGSPAEGERSKGGRCIGLTTLPISRAYFVEILWVSASWSRKGLPRPVLGWLLPDMRGLSICGTKVDIRNGNISSTNLQPAKEILGLVSRKDLKIAAAGFFKSFTSLCCHRL